jgi:hypothetical protein
MDEVKQKGNMGEHEQGEKEMSYNETEMIEQIEKFQKTGGKVARVAVMARELGVSEPTIRKYVAKIPTKEKKFSLQDIEALGYTIGKRAVINRALDESKGIRIDFDTMTYIQGETTRNGYAWYEDNKQLSQPFTVEDAHYLEEGFEVFTTFNSAARTPGDFFFCACSLVGDIWESDYFLKWGVEQRTADKYLRLVCAAEEIGQVTKEVLETIGGLGINHRPSIDTELYRKGFVVFGGSLSEDEPPRVECKNCNGAKIRPSIREFIEYYRDRKIPERWLEFERLWKAENQKVTQVENMEEEEEEDGYGYAYDGEKIPD